MSEVAIPPPPARAAAVRQRSQSHRIGWLPLRALPAVAAVVRVGLAVAEAVAVAAAETETAKAVESAVVVEIVGTVAIAVGIETPGLLQVGAVVIAHQQQDVAVTRVRLAGEVANGTAVLQQGIATIETADLHHVHGKTGPRGDGIDILPICSGPAVDAQWPRLCLREANL